MKKDSIKGIRLIIVSIVLLFVIMVIIRIFLDESQSYPPLLVNSTTVIIALWVIIILFSITFLFILIRNMIKLYYEKNVEYAGGRFKNRLVFFFIAFSIFPTILLFFFATNMITRSIDKWFSTDIDAIMMEIGEMERSYYDKAQEELTHYAQLVSEQIKDQQMYTEENKIYLSNTMRKKMIEYKLDVVTVYRGNLEIQSIIRPYIPLQEYKDLPQEMVYRGLGGSNFQVDSLKSGELIRIGSSFDTRDDSRILVIIGKFYAKKWIQDLRALGSMVSNYSQLKIIKDPIKTTYVLLFIFVTILVIFSASWLGYYLAKSITVPIEKLAAAASEISKGNLDVKIEHKAKNEFNTLINQFNSMVYDLRENQDKLSRRTIELRQRRGITDNILKNITSGVVALNSKGEIIDINPEAGRMLSLNIQNSLKKHFSEAISVDTYKDINELINKAFKSKFKLIEKEIDIKIKGKIINLATKITQIRNPINKKFSGLLVVLTEMTDLIKAQRLLVWREVAKRIAHEIKNPLTPIQISAQRILRSMDQPDSKFRGVVEGSLNIILQELDSIKQLADEFSNFARLPEIQFGKGDINQILEKLVSVYSSIYKEIEFKVNLDVEIPMMLKIDSEQVRRIFVNILDNGIEAMGKEGIIDISSKYNKQNQFVTIEIADNGPGISDEDKQKLFIPYFSKNGSGTGLGLAITHNIIEEHNGQISIVDNNPKGARFIIELPN